MFEFGALVYTCLCFATRIRQAAVLDDEITEANGNEVV